MLSPALVVEVYEAIRHSLPDGIEIPHYARLPAKIQDSIPGLLEDVLRRHVQQLAELGGPAPARPDPASIPSDPASLAAAVYRIEARIEAIEPQVSDCHAFVRAIQQPAGQPSTARKR